MLKLAHEDVGARFLKKVDDYTLGLFRSYKPLKKGRLL